MTSTLITKIFVGLPLSTSLKYQLAQTNPLPPLITEVSHNNKKYIGQFIPNPAPLNEIQALEKVIRETLQPYCPECNLDDLSCIVFPKSFVS